MTITRSSRVVTNQGGQTPQNFKAVVLQIPMNEDWAMMQEILNQQQREFRELLAQGLANIEGRMTIVNELVFIEQVNNGPILLDATSVH